MAKIPVGKIPADLLESLLKRYVRPDARVIVGPGIGEDATVIDMGDRLLVAKTDPVTFATDEIGWYAVHVNANDVACSGAIPRWFLATVLLPEDAATPALVAAIFDQLDRACGQLGVALCGGHTEVTHGLPRPIVVGQMLGEVAPGHYLTSAGARPGDALILTKGFAIEGTALIAIEKRDELRGVLSEADRTRCVGFLHAPGISVVRDAQVAIQAGGVHALHDPTEGGVATGLRELAAAAGVGLMIEEAALPVLPECATVCRHFCLDPLGLIGSGSLLVAAAADRADAIVRQLELAGVPATRIGQIVPPEQGSHIRSVDGSVRPLPSFPSAVCGQESQPGGETHHVSPRRSHSGASPGVAVQGPRNSHGDAALCCRTAACGWPTGSGAMGTAVPLEKECGNDRRGGASGRPTPHLDGLCY